MTYPKILSSLKTNGDPCFTNILAKWLKMMQIQTVQALDLLFIYQNLDFLKSSSFTAIILVLMIHLIMIPKVCEVNLVQFISLKIEKLTVLLFEILHFKLLLKISKERLFWTKLLSSIIAKILNFWVLVNRTAQIFWLTPKLTKFS